MNASVISIGRISTTGDREAASIKKMWIGGLAVSGAVGILAGFGGVIISLIAAVGPFPTKFTTIGIVMDAAAFPLFMFSAHCMDKIGNAEK